MARLIYFAFALLLAAPAFAQQPSLAEMQAARNNFMVLFGQCDSNALALQAQITKLQAEIDTLRAPKQPEPKQEK